MMKKKIVILSGAGLDKESGISTFRCNGGMWGKYKIEEVCTPTAWDTDPTKVNDFYNERRIEVINASPNPAHTFLATLEEEFNVIHLTQNVSDLLERAGCKNVIHLHGNILEARSSKAGTTDRDYVTYSVGKEGLNMGSIAEDGFPLRPNIIFFGESLPKYKDAEYHVRESDAIIVVGTSLQVYPVAGLPGLITDPSAVWYVDPGYNIEDIYSYPVKPIKASASVGLPIALKQIRNYFS